MDEFVPFWDRKKTNITEKMQQIIDLRKRGYNCRRIAEILGVKPESIYHVNWIIRKRLEEIELQQILKGK